MLYGHGADPQHIALPAHQTMLALKNSNALFTLDIEGTEHLAIPKDVQRDPVRHAIEHIDLLVVRKGEKVTVEIGVHVVGEAAAGTITMVEAQTVSVLAEATHLPEGIEVSVEGLEAGTQVRGADLVMPKGAEFAGDPDSIIVSVTVPRAEVEETEDAVADETAETAETAESDAADED